MSQHPPARARYFSLDDAERTLPLVSRIVDDIQAEYRELQAPVSRLRELGGRVEITGGREDAEATEIENLQRDIERRSARLNAYLDELISLGCHFKDFDLGLVDFFSRLDGRPVHLCWKAGESRIEHWHEIDAGFAGRRPIAPAVRSDFTGE